MSDDLLIIRLKISVSSKVMETLNGPEIGEGGGL